MRKFFILSMLLPFMAMAQSAKLSDSILNDIEIHITKPFLWSKNGSTPLNENPDWRRLFKTLSKHYNNDYTSMALINAKIEWFGFKKDSTALAATYSEQYSSFPPDPKMDVFELSEINNTLFNLIFQHSTARIDVNEAANIAGKLVLANPTTAEVIDTYANLLYKSGRIQEAISYEEKAHKLKPNDAGILETLIKMKNSDKTWKRDLK